MLSSYTQRRVDWLQVLVDNRTLQLVILNDKCEDAARPKNRKALGQNEFQLFYNLTSDLNKIIPFWISVP